MTLLAYMGPGAIGEGPRIAPWWFPLIALALAALCTWWAMLGSGQ